MQIDIGFGDAVDPVPQLLTFPVLLLLDAPTVLAYPPEVVVAEKFHAMVRLGIANSRMKDFFDVWTLASVRSFEIGTLGHAIRGTFERRRTELPRGVPFAFTREFLEDAAKNIQWKAFLGRIGLGGDQPALGEVGSFLAGFLLPAVEVASRRSSPFNLWAAPGPWT